MRHALALALRYMAFHRLRTAILLVCLSLAMFLPATVHVLVGYYNRVMIDRANTTPLVLGAAGSKYDLILNTLYFRGRLDRPLTMREVHAIREEGRATAVPIYVRHKAGGITIVGTSLDYFEFRGLKPKEGTLPQWLGDVVLGATAARRLELGPGDRLLSDDEKLYDISSTNPLWMRVTGVLKETGTADDLVIFADVKTTWTIEGIGHGHVAAQHITDPTMFRAISQGNVVMSGAVMPDDAVAVEKLDRFHFHGEEAAFPITAVIVLPHDARSATILKTRYGHTDDVQAVVPRRVVEEMMDEVFRVKRFFDAMFAVVAVATGLFLALVMWLSMQIRQGEFQTLHRIGCRRSTVLSLQVAELALLMIAGAAIAGGLLATVMWYIVRFDVLL